MRFGGSKVGRVAAISLDPEDQSRLRVEANVRADVPVNEASEAHITQTTLTAEMHLEISTGEKDSPLAEDGALIPSQAGGCSTRPAIWPTASRAFWKTWGICWAWKRRRSKRRTAKASWSQWLRSSMDVDTAVKEGEGLVGDVRGVVSERKGDIEAILKKVQEAEDAVKELLADVNAVVADNRGATSRARCPTCAASWRRQADYRARGRGLRAVGFDSRFVAEDAEQCRESHR